MLNKTHTQRDGNEVTLNICLREQDYSLNGRKVLAVTMYADTECCGDLAVEWEAENDDDYTHNTALLMRNASDNNNNTATMGEFYWEHAFDDTLHTILQENGFSKAAAEEVSGSEWGMQDVGRASYDAYSVAEEMLAAHNIKIKTPY
jgi:hypothetical protein